MSHAPSTALERRHARLRRSFDEFELDALIVTALPSITYVSNFTGTSAIVVLTRDRVLFLTDSRYVTVVSEMQNTAWSSPDFTLVVVEGSYDAALLEAVAATGASRVGFEAGHMTVSRHRWLTSTAELRGLPTTLVPTEGLVESARLIKDDYELGVLREAGRRLSEAARAVLGDVRVGISERELSLAVDGRIHAAGFERTAFPTIVASGPNAALPHARPTDRTLGEGDLVVLDFGGVYDSYCVDLTRTVVLGRASTRSREVYEAVRGAHDAAIGAIGPGRSRFAIDAAARDYLGAAGMADAFGHGTGHGLGIEVHEDPRITRLRPGVDRSHEFVAPGMVFTIEPGAYFPGWGGVRIEDDLLVTDTGCELLTNVTTELLEI
jgi:Xaa-Pro aminopeptidase